MKHFQKSTFLLVLIAGLFTPESFSQVANGNIWYFGYNAGIDFNSGSPISLSNGAIHTWEGCASICNNSGSILFYTDGVTVYNSNHTIMQNGTGLYGHNSSTQSAVIVPLPGSQHIYYIFTTDEYFFGGNLAYSIVDMTLAGGLGAVTVKNSILLSTSTEKVTAVKAANGIDFWVAAHGSSNNLFYAYLLTSAGVANPVVSTAGTAITSFSEAGYMKFSPQGTKLAVTLEAHKTYELFNFNKATGIVSNGITLGPLNYYTYSCEFSPSGQYLYVSEGYDTLPSLFQYDVTLGTSAAINASKILIGIGSGPFYFGALQNAPDGKIYVARESKDSIGVINNPNAYGLASDFVDQGFYLGGDLSGLGLPNFVTSIFNIPTGINEPESVPGFTVFPNPVTTQSRLSFANNEKEKFEFRLFDITGRMVDEIITSGNEITISKSDKSSGTYFFTLVNTVNQKSIYGKVLLTN